MRRLITALPFLLAAMAAAPASAKPSAAACAPKVSFQWIGANLVKLWTDAEFSPEQVATVAPRAEGDVILASFKGGPDAEAVKDPTLVPIVIRVSDRRPIAVRKAATDRYISKDDPTGYTFVLDLRDEPLVSRGGRAEVILRNVDCPGGTQTIHVTDAVVMEQHHFAVDVGASFSLDRNGNLSSHPEYSANSYSRWTGWLSGGVDLRITTLEKVAEDSTTDQGTFLASGGNTLDGSGRLFLNIDPRWRKVVAPEGTQPWLALVGGAGVRSVPGRDAVDARFRYFAGGRVQVLGYNSDHPAEGFGNAVGYMELVVGRDLFWRDTEEWRIGANAQLEIPNFGGKYVRFLARVAVDRPLHLGNTSASEIRLSVLSSINPAVFGALLGFSPKTAP